MPLENLEYSLSAFEPSCCASWLECMLYLISCISKKIWLDLTEMSGEKELVIKCHVVGALVGHGKFYLKLTAEQCRRDTQNTRRL